MNQEIQWLLKEKYGGGQGGGFARDVTRLKKGEPLAYLIGFVHFFGCVIDLSKKPLIPRSETEFWIQQAVLQIRGAYADAKRKNLRVLDMFAGSGCLGVSIMRHMPNSRMVFAEKSKRLTSQIALNCSINGIQKKRFRIVQSDIFSSVRGTFDVIVANPPYIPSKKMGKVHTSVLQHEPAMALFGGDDGLLHSRKFLANARRFLDKGGLLFMEFDPPQKAAMEKMCKEFGYARFECRKDQYGKWRYLVAVNHS